MTFCRHSITGRHFEMVEAILTIKELDRDLAPKNLCGEISLKLIQAF